MRGQVMNIRRHVGALFITILFCALLAPGKALAATANEYYVWNGFGPVSSAFQKVALIFSDNSYLVFFTCFAVLAITFGAASAYAKMLGGGSGGYLTWMLPVMFGTMIYLGFLVPKTHIEIYDAVLNQNVSIPGVPVGIVYTATMLNHVERALVGIVNTSAPIGRDYTLTAGGIGIDLLGKTAASTVHDANASRTMGEFVQKCVMFELSRPGTTMSMQNLLVTSGGTTILDAMVDAKNPAVYTVNYMTNPAGDPMTCSNTYDALKTYYTSSSNMALAISNACGSAGIDPTDGAAVARCQGIISDTASNTFGTTVDATGLVSNAAIATITANYLKNASAQVATEISAASNITQSGGGEGFTSIFNSISRSAFTAFVIALIPLVALFIPTPLCKNALAMIFGLFVWVIVWNVCELVIHHFFMDYYYRTVTSVTNAGLGMQAMLDIPSYASVTMGTFGKLKAGAAGFATVVTGGIFKFGGSEMSHFAARMGNTVSGSQATMMGSAGQAGAVGDQLRRQEQVQMARMTAPWSNQGAVSMDQYATGKSAKNIGMAAQGAGMLAFAGGSAASMFDNTEMIASNSTATQAGQASNISRAQAFQSGQVNAESIKGNLAALGENTLTDTSRNAFVSTMKNSASAAEYDGMVSNYASAAGINMSTDAGRKQAYSEFAALDLASQKGIMNAFADKDGSGNVIPGSASSNYQAFQEANHGKSRGQLDGESRAFAAAKAAGGPQTWQAYHALQSQMSSFNGYANASVWQDIAKDHYAGQPLKMFSDIQKVQNSQGAGHATGSLKEAEAAMGAGVVASLAAAGITDQATLQNAKEGYRLNGQAGVRTALENSEWGRENPNKIGAATDNAHNAGLAQGIHAIAEKGGQVDQLKKEGTSDGFTATPDSNDVRAGAKNEFEGGLGKNVDAVAFAQVGSGLSAREQSALTEGIGTLSRIASAQMQQTASAVMFGGSDPQTMMGQFKSSAGIMSGVLTETGAAALNDKLGKKGLFKKGDQVTYGMGADGSVSVASGNRGGYKLTKNGQSRELWNNNLKNTGTVTESRTQSFSGSNTVAGDFVDKVDKNGTETKGAGIVVKDPSAPDGKKFVLTNGENAQVITGKAVETIRDKDGNAAGEAVVTRQGDKSGASVAVKADGSTSYDASKTVTIGTNTRSVQTLAGSADDGSLGGGTTATNVAIAERSVSVAAEKVGEVAGIVAGPRRIASPHGALTRAEAKAEQEAAKAAAAPPPPPPPKPAVSPQPVARRTAAVAKSRAARYQGKGTPTSKLPDAQNGTYTPKYPKPAGGQKKP